MNQKNENFKREVMNAINKSNTQKLNNLYKQLNTSNNFLTPNNRNKLRSNIKSKLNAEKFKRNVNVGILNSSIPNSVLKGYLNQLTNSRSNVYRYMSPENRNGLIKKLRSKLNLNKNRFKNNNVNLSPGTLYNQKPTLRERVGGIFRGAGQKVGGAIGGAFSRGKNLLYE